MLHGSLLVLAVGSDLDHKTDSLNLVRDVAWCGAITYRAAL